MPAPDPSQLINKVRLLIGEDTSDDLADELIEMAIEDAGGEKYGAASRALVMLAARYKKQFDISTNEQKLMLSQKKTACLELSAVYAGMVPAGSIQICSEETWF